MSCLNAKYRDSAAADVIVKSTIPCSRVSTVVTEPTTRTGRSASRDTAEW